MATTYTAYKLGLTEGQLRKVAKAHRDGTAVTIRVKAAQIGNGTDLMLTSTQINHLKKAKQAGKGAEVKMSMTQIKSTQMVGNLASTIGKLAVPLIRRAAPAVGKIVATSGLSYGVEKLLKSIFGNGFGPQEVQLYKMYKKLTPAQKKMMKDYMVKNKMITGSGTQKGGFLGTLAAIGVPIAIDLISKMFGKGWYVGKPPPPPRGGALLDPWRSPPFIGSWEKKM